MNGSVARLVQKGRGVGSRELSENACARLDECRVRRRGKRKPVNNIVAVVQPGARRRKRLAARIRTGDELESRAVAAPDPDGAIYRGEHDRAETVDPNAARSRNTSELS
jgi:hypothetical protein